MPSMLMGANQWLTEEPDDANAARQGSLVRLWTKKDLGGPKPSAAKTSQLPASAGLGPWYPFAGWDCFYAASSLPVVPAGLLLPPCRPRPREGLMVRWRACKTEAASCPQTIGAGWESGATRGQLQLKELQLRLRRLEARKKRAGYGAL